MGRSMLLVKHGKCNGVLACMDKFWVAQKLGTGQKSYCWVKREL